MTMLAGIETTSYDPDREVEDAAGRMHITTRGVTVGPALSAWGEALPASQAAHEGCPRAEVRMSYYLSGNELLAGLWNACGMWDLAAGFDSVSDEVIRWHVTTSLFSAGGPGSIGVESLLAQIARERTTPRGQADYVAACRTIARVFGVAPGA
ncbi:hypothetical protein [Kitasatospora sp. NPDC001527]|uniref:hypothetical protein n=1 Tax=Kitasatospora sp. NPDC001527 TaxID=3154519 RepID=UPI00332E5A6C